MPLDVRRHRELTRNHAARCARTSGADPKPCLSRWADIERPLEAMSSMFTDIEPPIRSSAPSMFRDTHRWPCPHGQDGCVARRSGTTVLRADPKKEVSHDSCE